MRGNLVHQIVDQVSALVGNGTLPPMERMPSVRTLAAALAVSSFSVVEAYDRLVNAGLLVSRRSSGYFVAPHRGGRTAHASTQPSPEENRLTVASLLQAEIFDAGATGVIVPAGSPYLPTEWSDAKWLQECGRAALRSQASLQSGFTHRLGLVDLRKQISRNLQHHGVEVGSDHILLVRSAAHGLDLVLRTLLQAGDPVLIEDPSYPGILPLLDLLGCEPLLVPRCANGLDLERLEALARERKPKLAIITTVLHNPLGLTLSAKQAHQLLALAERFDFRIVEDDVFRELSQPRDASLAAMDGLRRVIRIGGTSKLLPSIASVGSVAASLDIIEELARVKTFTGLASSGFSEKVALHALSSSEFRRHVTRVRARLDAGRESTCKMLEDVGMELIADPQGGIFASAQLRDTTWSGTEVARFALERGIVLSPSLRFTRTQGDAPWFRFNVAYGAHPKLREVFEDLMRTPHSTRSPTSLGLWNEHKIAPL